MNKTYLELAEKVVTKRALRTKPLRDTGGQSRENSTNSRLEHNRSTILRRRPKVFGHDMLDRMGDPRLENSRDSGRVQDRQLLGAERDNRDRHGVCALYMPPVRVV